MSDAKKGDSKYSYYYEQLAVEYEGQGKKSNTDDTTDNGDNNGTSQTNKKGKGGNKNKGGDTPPADK